MLSACFGNLVISPVPSLIRLVVDGQEALFLQSLKNRLERGILRIGNLFDDLAQLISIGVLFRGDRQDEQVEHWCIHRKYHLRSPSSQYIFDKHIIYHIIYSVNIYIGIVHIKIMYIRITNIWNYLYLKLLIFGITYIWDYLYLELLILGVHIKKLHKKIII